MNVIVATDSAPLSELISSMLPGEYEITVATSANEALELARSQSFHAVIADMQIGSMGGIALCMELKLDQSLELAPTPPVIVLLERRPDVFLARRAHADGWLLKPLDPIRLRRAIQEVTSGNVYADTTGKPYDVGVAQLG